MLLPVLSNDDSAYLVNLKATSIFKKSKIARIVQGSLQFIC